MDKSVGFLASYSLAKYHLQNIEVAQRGPGDALYIGIKSHRTTMSKFTFDFELADDLDETFDIIPSGPVTQFSSQAEATSAGPHEADLPFSEIPLSELPVPACSSQLDALPENVSYSPLNIPPSSGCTPVTLARRDLFDARFQVIAQDVGEEGDGKKGALGFLDAPSDLVPGVYEGGLKTWECSVDLAECLQEIVGKQGKGWVIGKRILEVRGFILLFLAFDIGDSYCMVHASASQLGCGTAIPTLFLLHELFHAPSGSDSSETHIHLQDYNRSVLELVTLPNILLPKATTLSPLSSTYRARTPVAPDADPHTPSELSFSPEFKQAFLHSLARHHVNVRFFVGSWDGLDVDAIWHTPADPASPNEAETSERVTARYDVVLTSETIYRMDSLPALVRVLRDASVGVPSPISSTNLSAPVPAEDLVEQTANLSLNVDLKEEVGRATDLCLVAAKVLYFGVGGGVEAFVNAVESEGMGSVTTVREQKEGVGRRVMRVVWR
ncbi:hypothetical protein EW146_g893 [Bondarzewia mesenterica]|uniref:protein-histidine N-methyltransferase n=1 Tax=Bondarzewia mesenterica TaxID=1095465 RepID=A0A4S4M7E8_9AGAM|nr:hypothetical protein EW146_g893 [Bondarzewia mesenterica]